MLFVGTKYLVVKFRFVTGSGNLIIVIIIIIIIIIIILIVIATRL